MNDMDPILPPTLDAALIEFYTEPQPDAVFAKRLEAQLRQRQVEMPGYPDRNRVFSFRK